jgi:hypothetical protein
LISVYLQPDITQIVRGRLRKDRTLDIQYSGMFSQSYLQIFDKPSNDEEMVDDLARLFYDVKEMTAVKREELYLVLPDYLFTMVDCFRYENDADIAKHIVNATGKKIEDFYYATPIITKPEPVEQLVTVCAIDRKIVDLFIMAADMEHIQLNSIEPASIAFLRCTGKFNKEEFVFQGFTRQATLIGYSSIAGLFKMDTPELSMENLGKLEKEEAENVIHKALIGFENTALSTFRFMNQDIPYVQLANPMVIQSFSTFQERLAERKRFPEFIQSGDIEESEQQDWMCVVGTLLQQINFSNGSFADGIDSYEHILSGNILPDNVQQNTKTYQFTQKLIRNSRIAIVLLFITTLIESIGILFLSSATIPAGLKEDYKVGQQTIEDINQEISVIQLEQKEHEYPMEALSSLVQAKPAGLGFVSLNIGSNENKAKDADSKWIKLKVIAADPLMFQDYMSGLSGDGLFSSVAVTQIGSDSSGLKTADIVIGKGNIAQ